MPRYDYRCRACGDTFEVTRSITAEGTGTTCPQGHEDTVKLLSTIALTGRSSTAVAAPPSGGGGGCCGGACGC
jgi:putative FmdB family regulatory protein